MAKKIFTNESLATFVDEIKAHIESSVSNKANKEHDHDAIYYTKEQIDNMEFITLADIDEICGVPVLSMLSATYDEKGNVTMHGENIYATHDGNGNVTLIM